MKYFLRLLLLLMPGLAFAETGKDSAIPDFTTEVRPILSGYCFKCHGPDDKSRKGKLRLDLREEAMKEAKSGGIALVPHKPDESELVLRIHSDDEKEVMPPPSAKNQLTVAQKDILKRWIAAGAEYKEHWAFIRPAQVPPPEVKLPDWSKNPIDRFALARMEKEGLAPSPRAEKHTLIRRVALDLTGLPPTPEEADAYVNDTAPDAYEKLVDRLIASPHYGERWARRWLDLARYADTNGYEKDRDRSIWPWRDWVINAMNSDMPFDQFTIEQLAGDLLPGATLQQKIATGFHRNTMLNEEGGIDPLEFRFNSVTDRVATTGITWLGLTVGCAQCHTHKYDPITHREYFQMMAFLNNADEPDMKLPVGNAKEQETKNRGEVEKIMASLVEKFPLPEERWQVIKPAQVVVESGAKFESLDDGSTRFRPWSPETETTTLELESADTEVAEVRLEALADPSFNNGGSGRAPNGNFVLTNISFTATPMNGEIAFATVKADREQIGFPITNAVDEDPKTGWAVDLSDGKWNMDSTAVFTFKKPLPKGCKLTVKLEQNHGGQHTLGRVRFSVRGQVPAADSLKLRERAMESEFSQWLAKERAQTVPWQIITPVEAKSNLPLLTVKPDGSVLASGDISKSDTYELKFAQVPQKVTAIRLEALPDSTLPGGGPGLTYYEGPKGDFFMSEFQMSANGQPVKLSSATESYAKNAMGATSVRAVLALDGDLQTGWNCAGRPGERHVAVFIPEKPINANELSLKIIFGRHYACSLGRFRISVTTAGGGIVARDLSENEEALLASPEQELTPEQRAALKETFLLGLQEFSAERKRVTELRKPVEGVSTLVFTERPLENPRPTFIYNRGEFLQPTERVEVGTLSIAGPLPANAPRNRLGLARWLVSAENPLTARVTVNRQWAAFFGRGLVRTTEDFGFQGEFPSHPDLLDWLAVDFVKQGWSLKKLHRLIVTSAAYQQSSQIAPELLARDPDNRLLARGPRVRMEAEMIRDSLLRASNLLTTKTGGPSVHPPQPDGVFEAAYGNPKWIASIGEDRFRRSLYTFAKRTAPFALYNTFDAPTGEACLARRDVSNTPLQALSLLNDVVFQETAQAFGREFAVSGATTSDLVKLAFRRILTRLPNEREAQALEEFWRQQKQRFESGALDAAKVGGDGPGSAADRAVWTALVRILFNLDETITKG